MVNIITRGESRKLKDRNRKAAKRSENLFRNSENEKLKKRVTNLRQNKEYVQASNLMRNNQLDSESEEEENSHDNNYDSINFINNNSIGSASELRPSGILHVDDVPISKKELTLLSFQKLVDSINHQSEWRKYAEDIDNFSDDLTTDSDQEDQETADESFLISSFNGKLTTANLRIDYQYRGISLRNICLYDYAATIRKIPINSHELSMLSGQCLREGNYRFFFHGNNFTNNHVHESDNSDVYNNELLKNWQTTITSRKMPWKDKVNDLEDIIPPNIYTNYSHNNNLSLDIHTNQIDDSLE
ncbi:18449_t:CDS:2, partial [Dentiscutata erythropus]